MSIIWKIWINPNKSTRYNWFDMFAYRLFFFCWNKHFKQDERLREAFIGQMQKYHLEQEDKAEFVRRERKSKLRIVK